MCLWAYATTSAIRVRLILPGECHARLPPRFAILPFTRIWPYEQLCRFSALASRQIRRSGARVVGVKSPLQCAGINRHEVEDERALRERSSDPLGPESCTATARDTEKRRQGIGGVGIQLRKDEIRTPTSL